MLLNQRNICNFECRIFWKQKLLCEFCKFLVILQKSVVKGSLLAFSMFFLENLLAKIYVNFFCSRNIILRRINLKSVPHSFIVTINIKLRLTNCSCFRSQRSVFCKKNWNNGGNATLNEVYVIKNSLRMSHSLKFVYRNLFQISWLPKVYVCEIFNVHDSWS